MDMNTWLAARYLIDTKSRNLSILREFLDRLFPKDFVKVIDLGSGIGSNFRFLQSRIPCDQHWTFIELNEALLNSSIAYLSEKLRVDFEDGKEMHIDDKKITVELVHQDMLDPKIHELDGDIAVANAVFDLFSEQQFKQIVELLEMPLMYFTINYNGTKFIPGTDADKHFLSLYNDHMRREQGFGRAMGPNCANTMVDILNQDQYDTIIGPSDWIVDADHTKVAHLLIDFMEEAIPDLLDDNSEVEEFEQWLSHTRSRIDSRELTIKVLHDDILAIKKSNT